MQGTDVHTVLKRIGATHVHHANSVRTSSTFLEQGGLLSRGFVEVNGLKQTAQSSDEIDKKYGIWHSVFVDHVDIHDRGGRKKGPNQYGPVLFQFDVDILLGLPTGTEVHVTKLNPVRWYDSLPDDKRWFQSVEELSTSISFGDFDKMLVIQTPLGKLDFPNRQARTILDDPQRRFSADEDVYAHAENRLKAAATVGQIEASIEPRKCQSGCICIEKYAKYTSQQMDFWFT